MIYQWLYDIGVVISYIRHFFRALVCKHYYVDCELPQCDITNNFCESDLCPKMKKEIRNENLR